MERPEGSNEMPPGVKAQSSSESSKPSSSTPSSSTPKPAAPPAQEEDVVMEDDEDVKLKKEADELKAKGTVAYKARKFDEAEELYSKAWETWGKDITYLTNLTGKSSSLATGSSLIFHSCVFREGRISEMHRDVRESSRGGSRAKS